MSSTFPSNTGPVDTTRSPFTHLKTLEFNKITLNRGFWSERQAIIHNNSLRHAYEMLEKSGNFHNLRLAAGLIQGRYRGRNFIDSDVYKWLEAVAWELGKGADPELQKMADEAIALVGAAQQPDGYINSYYTVTHPQAHFVDLDHGHELYCAGHLFQAAVAFQRAIGDHRLIEIAGRFADLICATFGPDKRHGYCGHPEVEMALIEMYRATGATRYLEMAKFFIDQRGQKKMQGYAAYGPEYHQDHLPVRQVSEAAGHSVRQLYLASGVTDLYLETGEQALLEAMQRLSGNICTKKLYITGGVGSRFDGEAFGDPYELPPDQCYCETCAAIASLMWNWRMLLVSGDAFYADQMETALYNNILASPALDGKHFFYLNPLMLREARFLRLSNNPPPSEEFIPNERPAWHDVACCPPNVMRTLASLGSYLATQDAQGVQIHHYAPADVTFKPENDKPVSLKMTTGYPWQGNIKLEVTSTGDNAWTLSLRLPGWCQKSSLMLNGQPVNNPDIENGYARIERVWHQGDVVELDLEIEPVLVAPHPRIDDVRGTLAIQRGPIVYCLEDVDQEVKDRILDIELDGNRSLEEHWRDDLLGGVMVIEVQGRFVDSAPWQSKLYRPAAQLEQPSGRQVKLVAVPYYAWGNRGIGGMRVWIPAK